MENDNVVFSENGEVVAAPVEEIVKKKEDPNAAHVFSENGEVVAAPAFDSPEAEQKAIEEAKAKQEAEAKHEANVFHEN